MGSSETCELSVDHYKYILDKCQNMGYSVLSMKESLNFQITDKSPKSIVLRHDVDVSLENALKMAQLESELMVSSTYFIRLHSKFYDPMAASNLKMLKTIGSLAEVGLHYERKYYETRNESEISFLKKDMDRLKNILKLQRIGCAPHMPGTVGNIDEDEVKKVGSFYEASHQRFMVERKYISDSGGKWREGCACQWLGIENHLTILTHPIWWFGMEEDPQIILEKLRSGF